MASENIKTLQVKQKDTQKSILTSMWKTGFLGILANFQTIANLSHKLLDHGFRYILTHQLSQDHLETLFSE